MGMFEVTVKLAGLDSPLRTEEISRLGRTALESLGLLVDPVAQKLIPRNLRLWLCFDSTAREVHKVT